MSFITPTGLRIDTNNHGNQYVRGRSYDLSKKLQVAKVFSEMKLEGLRISKRSLGKRAGVGETFANKIINEMITTGGDVVDPKENFQPNRKRGVGSMSLTEDDDKIIKKVRSDNPQAPLAKYTAELNAVGTMVSPQLISAALKKRYAYPATLRNADLIPIDKFKAENILRFEEFDRRVQQIDPSRIKSVDEKLLKGAELINRKVRRDPDTGEVPSIRVDSDFRNTYSLVGFCGMDPKSPAFFFHMTEANIDSCEFRIAVEQAIASNFLQRYDFLLLDNAIWHKGGYNNDIEDFLWNFRLPNGKRLKVTILWLPARAPELNPIELLWNTLVQRLQADSYSLRQHGRHAVAKQAARLMKNFTHELVESCYRKCGYK
jgi:hypothetical protein